MSQLAKVGESQSNLMLRLAPDKISASREGAIGEPNHVAPRRVSLAMDSAHAEIAERAVRPGGYDIVDCSPGFPKGGTPRGVHRTFDVEVFDVMIIPVRDGDCCSHHVGAGLAPANFKIDVLKRGSLHGCRRLRSGCGLLFLMIVHQCQHADHTHYKKEQHNRSH